MPYSLEEKLVVAITDRTVFDLETALQVYLREGVAAYREYQLQHENEPLSAGVGMPMVRALLGITDQANEGLVEVVIVSPNDADSGLRVINSIEQWGLPINRVSFTGGRSTFSYLSAYATDLFLSAEISDVVEALEAGYASGRVLPADDPNAETQEVRLAFDANSYLFEAQADVISRTRGLESFQVNELTSSGISLAEGPFNGFLEGLSRVQSKFSVGECPIRTVLLTTGGVQAHKRAVETLRKWNVAIDESHFVGEAEKGRVFDVVRPHVSFDVQSASLGTHGTSIPGELPPSTPEDSSGFQSFAPAAGAPAFSGSVYEPTPEPQGTTSDFTPGSWDQSMPQDEPASGYDDQAAAAYGAAATPDDSVQAYGSQEVTADAEPEAAATYGEPASSFGWTPGAYGQSDVLATDVEPLGDDGGAQVAPPYGESPAYAEGTIYGEAPGFGETPAYTEGTVYGEPPAYGEAPAYSEGTVYGEAPAFGEAPAYSEGTVYGEAPAFGETPAYPEGTIYAEGTTYAEGTVYAEPETVEPSGGYGAGFQAPEEPEAAGGIQWAIPEAYDTDLAATGETEPEPATSYQPAPSWSFPAEAPYGAAADDQEHAREFPSFSSAPTEEPDPLAARYGGFTAAPPEPEATDETEEPAEDLPVDPYGRAAFGQAFSNYTPEPGADVDQRR